MLIMFMGLRIGHSYDLTPGLHRHLTPGLHDQCVQYLSQAWNFCHVYIMNFEGIGHSYDLTAATANSDDLQSLP